MVRKAALAALVASLAACGAPAPRDRTLGEEVHAPSSSPAPAMEESTLNPDGAAVSQFQQRLTTNALRAVDCATATAPELLAYCRPVVGNITAKDALSAEWRMNALLEEQLPCAAGDMRACALQANLDTGLSHDGWCHKNGPDAYGAAVVLWARCSAIPAQ